MLKIFGNYSLRLIRECLFILIDLYSYFCSTLTPLYLINNDNSIDIIPILKQFSTALSKLSFKISKEASSYAASQLSRILAASNTDIPGRRRALLHHANLLAFIYFKLQSLHSLPTALKAVKPHEHTLKSNFPASELTVYRYWLGRSKLSEWRIDEAYLQFNLAWRTCHQQAYKNLRNIVKYWLTTAVIIGKCPTINFLQKYDLTFPFQNLFDYVRKGDVKKTFEWMDNIDVIQFFMNMSVYTLLKEKLIIITQRSLLRRTLVHFSKK